MESLYSNEHQVRFNPDQKTALAVHIAAALSKLLGSEWTGNGWTTKDMYFLGEKKGDSQLPYGPFVSCSSNGPNSTGQTGWAANLVKTPNLILLGKLLLEIDLGKDLDGLINKRLEAKPSKNISVFLLQVHEKAKHELLYGEAILACLTFHRVRKLKSETEEIDIPIADWCEWDRKYIKDNIVKKLTPSSPHSKQQESVTHREHHAKHEKLFFASKTHTTTKRVESPLRPSTYQAGNSGDITSSDVSVFPRSLDQAHFIGATTTRQEEHQSNKEVERPNNPVLHHHVRRQISLVKGNADVSTWLNDINQDPDVVRGESDSSTFEIEDEKVLFDDIEDSQPPTLVQTPSHSFIS